MCTASWPTFLRITANGSPPIYPVPRTTVLRLFFLPVCVRSGLATVARQQVELKAVEVAGPEDARVVARLLHEGDDGLADVGRLEGVLVRLPRLRTEANFAVNATSQNICEMDLRPRGIIHG